MALSKIDLQGKDNASAAFKGVTDRVVELRTKIADLKAAGKDVPIDVKGLNNIARLTREADTLDKKLVQVTGDAKGTGSALGDLGSGADRGVGGLSNLVGKLAAVGIGVAAVKQAAGTFVELGQLGESAARSEIYFEAFSGSTAKASANLVAMRKATDGALTSQEAMRAGSKLMSMGLATNADDLGKISKMAVMLGGDTRSASEAINEFSLLLANQSILRLDTFGISGAKVRLRIEELQAATKGLSREAAFMTAVFEVGNEKVALLEGAGLKAASGTDKLRGAFGDLKLALADLVEKPYAVVIDIAQKGVGELTYLAGQYGLDKEFLSAKDEYNKAAANLFAAQDAFKNLPQDAPIFDSLAVIGVAQAALDAAEAHYNLAKAAREGRSVLHAYDDASDPLKDIAESALVAAAALRTLDDPRSQRRAQAVGAGGAVEQFNLADSNLADYWAAKRDGDKKVNDAAAKDYVKKMNAAVDQVVSAAESKLKGMQSASVGLKDFRVGGTGKPGEDGAAENIFRLQAWLTDGSWQETADQLGIATKDEARKIVQDFQNGLVTADVEKALNVDMLIEQIKVEQASEASTKAFAAKLAAAAGVANVGKVLASDTFSSLGAGFEADEKGAGAAADKAMSALAGAAELSVKADDLVKRLNAVGESAWGWTESGFVGAARGSGALMSAITAMVDVVLAAKGVTAASRASGDQ